MKGKERWEGKMKNERKGNKEREWRERLERELRPSKTPALMVEMELKRKSKRNEND